MIHLRGLALETLDQHAAGNANAHVASGEDATAVLNRLLAAAVDEACEVHWPAGVSTYLGSLNRPPT